MYSVSIDPESGKSLSYSGGTVTTSGSAVIPELKPSVYKNVENFYGLFKDDPEAKNEYSKKIRDFYFNQMIEDAKREEDTFKAQKIYGLVIFIIVIFLVSTGIGFSIIQFTNAIKLGNYSQLDTSLAVQSIGNIAITTSLVGVVVLFISMVFFFFFLQYVYKPNNRRKNFYKDVQQIKKLVE